MAVLEKGIKIPEALRNAEIILKKSPKKSAIHNYYYY